MYAKSLSGNSGRLLFCALEGNRSQIIYSPTLINFRDPDSRFRVLAKHRFVFLIPTQAKQLACSEAYSLRSCALGGNRTPGPLVRSQMLYPLSYERFTHSMYPTVTEVVRQQRGMVYNRSNTNP